MSRAKILIKSKVILEDQVLTIRLEDISSSDVDVQKLRIDILDNNSAPIIKERKVVEITEEFLVIWKRSRQELYYKLIQFRNSLPTKIHSHTRDLFAYPDLPPEVKMYRVGKLLEKYYTYGSFHGLLYADYIRNSEKIEYGEILSILGKYENNGVVKRVSGGLDAVTWADNADRNLIDFMDSLKPITFEDEAGGITVIPAPAKAVPTAGGARLVTSEHCNETMFDGSQCKLKPYSKNKCICHCDDSNKDVDQFSEVVNKMLKSKEASDFSGFVFPDNYEFPQDREFKGKLRFHKVTFCNEVNLSEKTFCDSVVFDDCRFPAGAIFDRSFFKGDVEFRSCVMERCSLDHARFATRVIFEKNSLTISEESFHFTGAIFDNPQQVLFKEIFLPQMTFSGCNVATVTILHLLSSLASKFDRHILGDEVELERETIPIENKTMRRSTYEHIIECYQLLQRNMLSTKNNSSAGKFHVRELEMERAMRLEMERTMKSVLDLLPFTLYKWLAYYGERISQPLLILIGVLLLFPFLTLFVMGDHNYDWTMHNSDIIQGLKDWGCDFVSNLRCIFYLDNDVFSYKTGPDEDLLARWHFLFVIEKLFSIVMLSFVVIAFRRRFRRY